MTKARSAAFVGEPGLGYWLNFPDPRQESRFNRQGISTWTQIDVWICLIALVAGSVKIATWHNQNPYHSAIHHILISLTTVCMPLIILFMIRRRPRCYEANREWMLSWGKFFSVVCGGVVSVVYDAIWVWAPSLLGPRMFSHTPLSVLMLTSLHRFPFKKYFWMQLAAALVSSMWVSSLCHACRENEEVNQAVNRLGWLSEGFLTRMAVVGFPVKRASLEQGQFSCWLVGLFYQFWLGFFVPSVLVYVSEFSLKLAFLRQSLAPEAQEELNVMKTSRLLLIGLVSIVGPQVIWVMLKGFLTVGIQCPTDQDQKEVSIR